MDDPEDIVWKKTFYGWHAFADGDQLSVRKYRAGDGDGWVYVARVNQSAATSPAQPHRTAKEAMLEAEGLVKLARDAAPKP